MVKLASLAVLAVLLSGCSIERFFLKSAWVGGVDYVAPPEMQGSELTKVAEGVYSFRFGFYRNLIVLTDEGVVVSDPMGLAAATALKAKLNEIAPGKPVHTMLYSHYHVDHAAGGAVLEAKNIIAPESAPKHWAELGAKDVAKPTRLVDGDQTLTIGGVEIRMLFLGRSHSDALYAIHLPATRVLHTADMGFVRMIPPLGIPDSYMPGVLAALDRLEKIDFDVFVPSHYRLGKKADFVDYVQQTRDLRKLVSDALAKNGGHVPGDKDKSGEMFASVYDPYKEKYGDWHGFSQMSLVALFRETFGQALGY